VRSYIKREYATYSLWVTAVGGVVGFKSGKLVAGQLIPIIGGAVETVGNTSGSFLPKVVNGQINALGGGVDVFGLVKGALAYAILVAVRVWVLYLLKACRGRKSQRGKMDRKEYS